MIIVEIDRSSITPIYKQIAHQIITMIDRDVIKEDDILPPSRVLAEKLGVSRFTVTQAYQELWGLGYIKSSQGSYTKVRKRPKTIKNSLLAKTENDLSDLFSKSSKSVFNSIDTQFLLSDIENKSNCIDLTPFNLDSRLFPMQNLKNAMKKVLSYYDPSILNYGDPRGFYGLREFIANRMRTHSIEVNPDQILITHGSFQGIELLTKLFHSQGNSIIVESPTFSSVIPLFQFYDAKLVGVEMTENGMNIEMLTTVVNSLIKSNQKPSFIYTIPSFHNPTGITTNQIHREAILSICEKNRIPLIEDCFEEEIKYFEKVVLPIKSMDKTQIVFYLGTFSKVLFPGIRMGWIAGQKNIVDKLALLKRFSDISSNTLMQASLYEFCKNGVYDVHVRKINRIFSKRMKLAVETLKKFIKTKNVTWIEPSGGYLIWITISNTLMSEKQLDDQFKAHGVVVAAGSLFYPSETNKKHIRLSISSKNENEIVEGVKRVAAVLNSLDYQL